MVAGYGARRADAPRLARPRERDEAKTVYWMYVVVRGDEVPFDAKACARRLEAQGIATRPFFLGMHEQPVLRDRGLFKGESYPVSERIARRGLYLPSGLTLTEEQIERVCEAVTAVLDRA